MSTLELSNPAGPKSTQEIQSNEASSSSKQETGPATGFKYALWRVWSSLVYAWDCFDRFAGYWIGLDVPKYQWAILEYERRKREEEEAVLQGAAVQQQADQDQRLEAGDIPEGQAPPTEVMQPLPGRAPRQQQAPHPHEFTEISLNSPDKS
eukprot:CAMPEP_0202920652 /NCGR_PEP_ID=MMETSP1392-20130828/76962_1 /ASSEMBLY_ACC=CAM_ASM_000868 /TAXON_ID=225041 /ORGANISM="Chlamydomonas chlamydogama, Strain SAG 11-48b" /LENGTH=150 /DNA_ID=CAMNT_0049614159 /DNA_START=87 /DNA_END=539 /DNA_ORIENTATION=+